MSNDVSFTFSDTIAGYVTRFDEDADSFGLRTSDGREFTIELTANTFAYVVRNFEEPYVDATAEVRDHLAPGRYLSTYGLFYPEGDDLRIESKSIAFPSVGGEFVFERPDWWPNQAKHIADFYLKAQFPDGVYDWDQYRTHVGLDGTKKQAFMGPDFRQETDTISRLIYGLASTYLLTGEDRFLEAAETGTEYLRDHLRAKRDDEGVVFWYHGMDVSGDERRKVFASEFGDDYDAVPMYEQIYALAGPTQTYRVTGDPRILDDIEKTIGLFDHFKDAEGGGYFSHVDPVTLDPKSETLGHNRARKNWNSVGDHAPAYLINAVIALGRADLEDFLVETADTIAERFPDYENSPFVQERFHEDWTHDRRWGWQQDNAVVGHNLKIAWNLMRIHHLRPNQVYVDLANKIAGLMPGVGGDPQRGGWYDVVARTRADGQSRHGFVWHDRKAWWQQEQGILAYLILAGSLGDPEHRRLARESAAFYNTWYLDHDDGGVYFNVLANGIPFLVGNERHKGSHSMSGYHSIELCYLAATYTNLLLTKAPLHLYFKPKAGAFPGNVLRVAPDLLPPGSIRLSDVWVDDQPYLDFDAEALTVNLPADREVRVKVRLVSTTEGFDCRSWQTGDTLRVVLIGSLGAEERHTLQRHLEQAGDSNPARLILDVSALNELSDEGISEIVFLRQKMSLGERGYVVGANEQVAKQFASSSATDEFTLVDDESQIPD